MYIIRYDSESALINIFLYTLSRGNVNLPLKEVLLKVSGFLLHYNAERFNVFIRICVLTFIQLQKRSRFHIPSFIPLDF